MSPLPRVSFILITYNQSAFVRQAIRGALAQDYDNLEIIISDDCSPDDTWQVIQDEVAATPTRHKVILNQTPGNQGLTGNINAGVRLSSGEWLVMAAGDDVSLPNRVSTLIAAARTSIAAPVLAVASQWFSIDEHGMREPIAQDAHKHFAPTDSATAEEALATILRIKPFPRLRYSGTLTGAAAAWHRSLFDRFGLLPTDLVAEDAVLTLRARLIGSVRYLPDRLLEYRKHPESMTNFTYKKGASRMDRAREQERLNMKGWRRQATVFRCMHRDLDSLPGPARDRFLAPLAAQAEACETIAQWWTFPWLKRLVTFPRYARILSLSRLKAKLLLPFPVYLAARALTLKKR